MLLVVFKGDQVHGSKREKEHIYVYIYIYVVFKCKKAGLCLKLCPFLQVFSLAFIVIF